MKELNFFIADNDDILDIYAQNYKLKPVEIEEIKQLLKEWSIDGGDWDEEE